MTKQKSRLTTVAVAFIVLLAAAMLVKPRLSTNANAETWSADG